MLHGDVHRFYERLRQRGHPPPEGEIDDLNHVREIARYYQKISPLERLLLLAWFQKEESGIGLLPLILSGIPLISLIFAPLIQGLVLTLPPWVWVLLWAGAILGVSTGFWVHQRHRAYTTLHIALLEQCCLHCPHCGAEVCLGTQKRRVPEA